MNNHIKSSLEFVHRGTVVFLRYFGIFTNQRPFRSLYTLVSNRTSLCLQQRIHTEVRSPTRTTHRSQKSNKDHLLTCKKNSKWCSRHFPKFWSEKMWPHSFPDLNLMDFCVWSFLGTKACSVAYASVEALKRSLARKWAKISQEHYRARTKSKEDLIWLLMLRDAILKNEVID